MIHRNFSFMCWSAFAMVAALCLPYISVQSVSEPTISPEAEWIKLSFYRGYLLWKDQLRRPGVPYDLEQVIAGMRAAEIGEYPKEIDPSELAVLIKRFQERMLSKEKEDNLANAERFLASIRADKDTTEVVKDRLYYRCLEKGSGPAVKANSSPILTFEARTLELHGEELFFDKPIQGAVSLSNTIPGFAKGVIGMLTGERRQLFIHPELAYGVDGGLVGPNRLMIFDVQVKGIEPKSGS